MRRGLASTRSEAKKLIEGGFVRLRGLPANRSATIVDPADPVEVTAPGPRFVSRGGIKLDGALRDLDVKVEGRRWLDAGASTGGFTDRLLQGGAAEVLAVDVGYGQLDWSLRNDPRVSVMERTNIRALTPDDVPWKAEGVVADLSFISLAQVLPALVSLAQPTADLVLLVKPQFEVGKGNVGKGGVVRDPSLWAKSLSDVVDTARELGLGLVGACVSDIKGPAGNVEFFVHLRRGVVTDMEAIGRVVEAVGS